jgi:hypothetical protein
MWHMHEAWVGTRPTSTVQGIIGRPCCWVIDHSRSYRLLRIKKRTRETRTLVDPVTAEGEEI